MILEHVFLVSDGHHRCDPVILGGCQRCRPKHGTICCDRCHPTFRDEFSIPHDPKKSTQRRSVIPVLYTRHPQHSVLKEAIHEWREIQTLRRFGPGAARRLGDELLMSDEVLERIMGCWTFHKITEVSHFRRETNWPEKWIQACGQSLIDLLISYSPLKEKSTLAPPSTLVLSEPTLVFSDSSTLAHPLTPVLSDPYPFPTPAQPSDHSTAASTGTTKAIEDNACPVLAALPRPRKCAQIRCGNCQQLGHNRMYNYCSFQSMINTRIQNNLAKSPRR